VTAVKTQKPPRPGQIQICLDGRVLDSSYWDAYASVDLPDATQFDGRVCIDTTLGTFVRASGGAWGALGGGGVAMAGDVTGTNAASVVTRASTTWAQTGSITIAVTANTDDWAPAGLSGASVIRVNPNSGWIITGLTGGSDGRLITIINISTHTVRFANNSGSSTAANTFKMPDAVNLGPNCSMTLRYDGTLSRWTLFSRDGTVTGNEDSGAGTFAMAIGYQAGPQTLSHGNNVTCLGYQAGTQLSSGADNTAVGSQCCPFLTTGRATPRSARRTAAA
jgi:hypothetical protein